MSDNAARVRQSGATPEPGYCWRCRATSTILLEFRRAPHRRRVIGVGAWRLGLCSACFEIFRARFEKGRGDAPGSPELCSACGSADPWIVYSLRKLAGSGRAPRRGLCAEHAQGLLDFLQELRPDRIGILVAAIRETRRRRSGLQVIPRTASSTCRSTATVDPAPPTEESP